MFNDYCDHSTKSNGYYGDIRKEEIILQQTETNRFKHKWIEVANTSSYNSSSIPASVAAASCSSSSTSNAFSSSSSSLSPSSNSTVPISSNTQSINQPMNNLNVKAQQHPQHHHMQQSTSSQHMNANNNVKNMIYMNNSNGTSGGSSNTSNGHINKYTSGGCSIDQHPAYFNDVSVEN
jgi:hypothetical protein